jgi:two-component system, OmpR family, sensor kinase
VSLRARLLLVLGAVIVAALAIADIAVYSALRASLFTTVDQRLTQESAPYAAPGAVGRPVACHDTGDRLGGFAGPGQGFHAPPISSDFVAVTTVGSSVGSNECPAYVNGNNYSPKLPTTFSGFSTQRDGSRVTYLSAASTNKSGPEFEVRVAVLPDGAEIIVATPISDTQNTLNRLALIEAGVSAAAVLAAMLVGWWLVRLGLRPLIAVEQTAESIAAGDLRRRVPNENDHSEVGRLAKALNVMLGRIESAFAARLASEERLKASDRRLRQFVGDASHELRTPLTAISAYAELFERGAAENPEDLTRVMTGIRAETARMDRLVADLLTLARLDEGQPIERISVELVTLCAEAAQTARTVAAGWPIALAATEPVEVEGDPHRLRQVLDNLLANVRAHTPEGTDAQVTVSSEAGEAVVVVADSGPGLPEDQAARVFERFFRSDPSRTRSRGGAGLGLSIVAAIVEAHGGTVSAKSAPGQGMTVTIRLPLAEPEPDPEPEPPADGEPVHPALVTP